MKLSEKYFNKVKEDARKYKFHLIDSLYELKLYGKICRLEERLEMQIAWGFSTKQTESKLNKIAKEQNL